MRFSNNKFPRCNLGGFAAPAAAGLAAYIRSKPNARGGTSPQAMFDEMRRLAIFWRTILAGRQEAEAEDEDGGSCPFLPISFRPGSPAPVCTANCGKLWSGIYGNPTTVPTVQPPDFTSPVPTATVDPSALPTLNPVPTGAPIPTDCASVSSWTTCTLGGPPGASACQTFSTCVSTRQPPAPEPTKMTTTKTQPANPCATPIRDSPECLGGDYYRCVQAPNVSCGLQCAGSNKLQQAQCTSQCITKAGSDCARYCADKVGCDTCIASYNHFLGGDEAGARLIRSRKGTPNYFCGCDPI
ncbi:uncharacterized protein B0I36DRAFT_358821 [Microdochium trichocladiopsis]|uniref:Uncharacterized protein n=1 Tax=Microdochium trichocladiopsis TaxID=1682393 RepID=A0A9P8YFK5_9PEZI|nr:uncharacterized protein B0I36DRAFT_358821 [Microdochium trichocladiopsis]KAH7037074.1 hypothetical protein B0I36DRAFT_358821 [Microdochium trichocladiopsis]